MRGGLMRETSIVQKARAKASREQAVWDKCRYIACRVGKTLDFARWLYHRDTGSWPPEGLKCCPPRESGDWKRRVADVYPWMRG
jgi:hypothetical protein